MAQLTDKLNQLRERAGFRSQQALADAMGVAKNRVWGYEKGKNLPDIDYLAEFSRQTGGDLSELLALRLEAGGFAPQPIASVRDESPEGYQVPDSLAELRKRLALSIMPSEWAMFLVELAMRGKISTSAAEEIADFFDNWEPSARWLESFE